MAPRNSRLLLLGLLHSHVPYLNDQDLATVESRVASIVF